MKNIHHSERDSIKKLYKLYAVICFCFLIIGAVALSTYSGEFLKGIIVGIVSSGLFGGCLFVFKILLEPYEIALQNDLADKIYTRIKDSKQSGIIKSSVGIRSELEYIKDLILKSKKTTIVETWIDESTFDLYREELKESLRKGNEVDIFILSPNSIHLPLRGADSSLEDDTARNKARVINTIEFLAAFEEEVKKNPTFKQIRHGTKFTVHQYDAMPRFAVYKWSRRAYVGFYLQGVRSSDGCQLRVNMDSHFGKHLEAYIKQLRKKSPSTSNNHTAKLNWIASAFIFTSAILAFKSKK